MSANYTTNKQLIQPANGTYNDIWDQPVNADWAAIDTCFGGSVTITVTGLASGSYTLSLGQYQPPNIIITGTQSGNYAFNLPSGVGGQWSVYNDTSGPYTVAFGSVGGSFLTLSQGLRTLCICDGTNMQLSDNAFATTASASTLATADANAQSYATTAQSNAESYAAAQAAAAQSAAESYAASLITSGSNKNGVWVKLPGGQILQWGLVGGQSSSPLTVTLPIPFATCQSINITCIGQFGSFDVSSVTGVTNNFVINFGASNTPFSWSAFGK